MLKSFDYETFSTNKNHFAPKFNFTTLHEILLKDQGRRKHQFLLPSKMMMGGAFPKANYRK